MAEKLFPLDIPPGFKNNGTTYQAKGRWHAGNFVRFFQGNIQPIGGWTKRTLTGDTITGTPNAAIAWADYSGNVWLAVGTSTGMWVINNSTNVVYDIMPTANVYGSTPYSWQLETFGQYLLAVNSASSFTDSSSTSNAWVWKGDTGAVMVPAQGSSIGNGPGPTYGVVVTPERFAVWLGGADLPTYAITGGPARPVTWID